MILKKNLTFILICLCAVIYAQKQPVRFQLTQIQPYCGGARPTPEMEAAARVPQPYAGQKLFIVSDKGIKDSLVTDTEGNFSIDLKPGTYSVYEAWKFHKRTPTGQAIADYDAACLKKEWKKEDIKIVVTSKAKPVITNNLGQGKCPWKQACLLKPYLPE